MPASKKRVAALHRLAGTLSGAGVRFMREAAAGAKPLIDAEGMASACDALGWAVTENLVGTMIEGDSAWEAYKWLEKELGKVTRVFVVTRRERHEDKDPEQIVQITGGSESTNYGRSSRGISFYKVIGQKDALEKVKRHLARFTTKSGVGDVGVTLGKRGVERQTKRVRDSHGRVVQQETGSMLLQVRVWVTLRSWSIANLSMKGTKKKPVVLTQQYKGLKPLDPNGIKAGQFWNSLYSRGLQADAMAYLEAEGAELPAEEDIETPEERIRRTFDQQVKKALEDFTGKQLKAVEQHFAEVYADYLERFLKYQDELFAGWKAEWKASGEKYPKQDFPPRGSSTYSRRTPTESETRGNAYRALAKNAAPFIERDEDDKLPYGVRVYKAKSDAKSLTVKKGKETAAAIREAFIQKNTSKLSAIITGKGNLDKIEIRSWSKQSFEGELDVLFADGSSFVVRNKTVYKVSNKGTWFAQFPTTFHFVKMPDGTKMKGTASERRMHREFAGI